MEQRYTAFGERLRRERVRRGLVQREVAARFDVSQPSYARWETGHNLPDDERRHAVSEFLGVTVTELWELMHQQAPPASQQATMDELAALRREVADVREMRSEVTELRALVKSLTEKLEAAEQVQ